LQRTALGGGSLSYRFLTKFLHAKSLPNPQLTKDYSLTEQQRIVSLTTLADCGPFTMSEVRPGGDSSDSLAEMTKPRNLQTPDSSAESIRQSHGDKHFVKQFDNNARLLLNSEQNVKSQQQYSTYNPETVTDSEAVQSSTDLNAGFASKVHIRQLFVGNVWLLYDDMHFRYELFIFLI
jgi:hypothetical protein